MSNSPSDNDDIKKMSDQILNEPTPPKVSVTQPPVKETEVIEVTEKKKVDLLLADPEYYMYPVKWVEGYNASKDITYDYKTDSVIEKGAQKRFDVYMSNLRLTAKTKRVDKNLPKLVLEDAVKVWLDKESKAFLTSIRQRLKYSPQQSDLVQTWVRACTGRTSPHDIAVMQHFIWQVKRKLNSLPVEHHMMPILYGKTGGGKSVAVLKLLEPISDICASMDLSIFSDQFKTRMFTRYYAMFFDEMARSDRADVDKLKNVLTSPTVDFRAIFTDKIESAPQNCTFIGCSNDLVHDKIYDPTSARRYWQIDCADKLDWNAINSIHYQSLWQSVDEASACPVTPLLSGIKAVQEGKIRHKDLVEEWLTTELAPKATHDPQKDPTSQQLYHEFSEWCKVQRINNQPTAQKFYSRLRQTVSHIGWKVGPHNCNRGTVWSLLPKDHSTSLAGHPSFEAISEVVEAMDREKQLQERIRRSEERIRDLESVVKKKG